MPSSYSPNLRFELQFTGENINTYGVKLDATFDRIDDAIAGYVPLALTGDHALLSANSNTTSDEARGAILQFTGALAVNATITIPSVSKIYKIWNATNRVLTITTGAGSTVAIDAGDIVEVFCDASNVQTLGYGGLALKDYITAFTASAGAVPSPIGNAGKYLYSDGANVLWRQPSTADLSDYPTKVVGAQIAFAAAL